MTAIVFVLFPGVTQLDLTGPAQVLSRLPGARVTVAAATRDPVATDSGFAMLPTATFDSAPSADILCVPGGHGVADALSDEPSIAFIRAAAESARWVTSVCTGAFLLGRAGLLDGRRATTHWAYAHLLPLVGASHQPGRVVEDGNLLTAGGVTAGIDFALTLVAREAGQAVAESIQLSLEYDPHPPFDSGTPATAGMRRTHALRASVYDDAAARMESALRDRAGNPQ
ncbi:DJ-1/PfpI family protein [Tsuneonella sp. YG55]|uniref:DJ-1/PfpI family protein n=1 Tax=Tsuneonella litorea TaxID=2976475 RepID=A0A9X2W053_9SPHN|nr:DJ-1/PfpI family protein [Tsuneonella litorea]MCT2557591.1 DJ-1/PfpI family protein [Tsuneonella litorea]